MIIVEDIWLKVLARHQRLREASLEVLGSARTDDFGGVVYGP